MKCQCAFQSGFKAKPPVRCFSHIGNPQARRTLKSTNVASQDMKPNAAIWNRAHKRAHKYINRHSSCTCMSYTIWNHARIPTKSLSSHTLIQANTQFCVCMYNTKSSSNMRNYTLTLSTHTHSLHSCTSNTHTHHNTNVMHHLESGEQR